MRGLSRFLLGKLLLVRRLSLGLLGRKRSLLGWPLPGKRLSRFPLGSTGSTRSLGSRGGPSRLLLGSRSCSSRFPLGGRLSHGILGSEGSLSRLLLGKLLRGRRPRLGLLGSRRNLLDRLLLGRCLSLGLPVSRSSLSRHRALAGARWGARCQGAGPRRSPEEASAEPEEARGRCVAAMGTGASCWMMVGT